MNNLLFILVVCALVGFSVSAPSGGNVERPGTCPAPGPFGNCVDTCLSDSDCAQDEKCCSNGCGHDCQTAIVSDDDIVERPGTCPAPGSVPICVNMCSADSECLGVQKCCRTGCGQICKDPIM